MQIGEKIIFSYYEWRVLDIQNKAVLIITEYIVESRPYHEANEDITWADCSLRKYLNGELFDSLTETDKSMIISVTNKNFDNQWYGAKGGEDTQDRIFLLSIEEAACRYFGDSSAILQNPGKQKYKYWFNRKDENNIKRLTNGSWWLRSPGRTNRAAAYIHGLAPNQLDSSGGCVGINGNDVASAGGIRLALWLRSE